MPKEILTDKLGVLIVLSNRRTPQQNDAIMDRHATHAARRLDNDIADIIGHDKPRFYMPGIATAGPDFVKMNAEIASERALADEKDKELKEALARISQRLESKGGMPVDMRLDPQDVADHEAKQELIREMFGELDER